MAGCHWADGNKRDDGGKGRQRQTERVCFRGGNQTNLPLKVAHTENRLSEISLKKLRASSSDQSRCDLPRVHFNQVENTEAKSYISVERL